MKCKNCGAGVEKDSSICTNCGAVVNKDSDYVLLTNQDNVFHDVYSNRDNNRKSLHRVQASSTMMSRCFMSELTIHLLLSSFRA